MTAAFFFFPRYTAPTHLWTRHKKSAIRSSGSCYEAMCMNWGRDTSAILWTYFCLILMNHVSSQWVVAAPYGSMIMTMPGPWWATPFSQSFGILWSGAQCLQWVVFCYRWDDVQSTMSLCCSSPTGVYQRLNSVLSTMNTCSIIGSPGSISTNFRADCNETLICCSKVPSCSDLHSKLAVSKIQRGPTSTEPLS